MCVHSYHDHHECYTYLFSFWPYHNFPRNFTGSGRVFSSILCGKRMREREKKKNNNMWRKLMMVFVLSGHWNGEMLFSQKNDFYSVIFFPFPFFRTSRKAYHKMLTGWNRGCNTSPFHFAGFNTKDKEQGRGPSLDGPVTTLYDYFFGDAI